LGVSQAHFRNVAEFIGYDHFRRFKKEKVRVYRPFKFLFQLYQTGSQRTPESASTQVLNRDLVAVYKVGIIGLFTIFIDYDRRAFTLCGKNGNKLFN
jgi:hypothetical protein